MKNHTLMQTIARANRVFRDKQNGLIVDYVGVFRHLEKALAIYGQGAGGEAGGGETPVKDKEKLLETLKEATEEVTAFLRERGVGPQDILDAEGFGYEVATFVRLASELAGISRYRPFDASDLDAEGTALYIAFLPAQPSIQAEQKLMAFRSEVFRVHGREVYWLCRKWISESLFSGALLEKTVEMPATIRNATTVRKLAAKYPASE